MKKVVFIIFISLFVFNIGNALAYEIPIYCAVSKKVGNNLSSEILNGYLLINYGENDSATLKLENNKVKANISLEYFSVNPGVIPSSNFSQFNVELTIKGTNYKSSIEQENTMAYAYSDFTKVSLTKGSTKYTVDCFSLSL